MRGALLDACRFDWSNISPAIFGALFQSVMDPVERRAQGGALHDREEHPQGDRAAVHGRPARRVRAIEGSPGQPASGRTSTVSGEARQHDLLRPGLRLRQLSDRRLPRAAGARNRSVEGGAFGVSRSPEAHDGRLRPSIGPAVLHRCGPVLRDRAWRVPGADRGDRAVDDGPHHEQSAEPRIRPDLRSHSAREIAAHRPRRRAGNGLDRTAAVGELLFRLRQSALRGREVPDGGPARAVPPCSCGTGSGGKRASRTSGFTTCGIRMQTTR